MQAKYEYSIPTQKHKRSFFITIFWEIKQNLSRGQSQSEAVLRRVQAPCGAMLLRINSHLHGASGIRLELIRRMERFLNAGVTPHVYEFGSIGASGDLVPLSYITGSLTGMDRSFSVDFNGEEMDAPTALYRGSMPAPAATSPRPAQAVLTSSPRKPERNFQVSGISGGFPSLLFPVNSASRQRSSASDGRLHGTELWRGHSLQRLAKAAATRNAIVKEIT